MKKIILFLILGLTVVTIISGGAFVFAKDSPVFDPLFPKEKQEERELNRMAKLYPETISDYSLYSWNVEKIQKNPEECEEVNETLNLETGNIEIKGEVCGRFTVAQYRQAGTNNVVFIHLYEMISGEEVFKNLFSNKSEKLGEYNIIRPERHEIVWLTDKDPKIDYIVTQEGTFKSEPDGGQSMSYLNKATGDNPVTKYFLSKFSPLKAE